MTCLLFLTTLLLALPLTLSSPENSFNERQERSIDPNFLRRYNHLKYEYRNNPIAFDFLKYFLRNRGQRRDRRQVDNRFVPNGPNFGNGFITYTNPNVASTPRTRNNKRDVTRRRKPFRPPMVFF
ncbi:hypothetical protein TcasGA2_TC009478 [Tribolium castaneum]|uniref:Uncharacterized protein n=1 Tax=Tribolium castaneum TaxID=7070 RepID=D6WRH3_TRICA|nr:PREDICTED: uncharacterized protein LOC103313517 [Tribolium castaneum]EFA06567.2 hypothetical protein TcasGA2_TC009478 [Tribolium castaneum]|eukprot:XP_008195189.1 PREDICTED: uncharacterized protein LOC103313517 [Tribolium castaneum]